MKWVYKAKKNAREEVERYKEKSMEKGYIHTKSRDQLCWGIVPVARLETVRLIISLAIQNS